MRETREGDRRLKLNLQGLYSSVLLVGDYLVVKVRWADYLQVYLVLVLAINHCLINFVVSRTPEESGRRDTEWQT